MEEALGERLNLRGAPPPEAPASPIAVVVGALGTLADVGRTSDIALVKRFLDEPGAPRREARRTQRILGSLGV